MLAHAHNIEPTDIPFPMVDDSSPEPSLLSLRICIGIYCGQKKTHKSSCGFVCVHLCMYECVYGWESAVCELVPRQVQRHFKCEATNFSGIIVKILTFMPSNFPYQSQQPSHPVNISQICFNNKYVFAKQHDF